MKILTLGASGLVGGNCLKHFRTDPQNEVVGTHLNFETPDTVKFNTLNLDDAENFDVEFFSPDVIIHCGALTWVDYCEQHPAESEEKTVQATRNVANMAKKLKAKLVYISSDYVFDGAEGPYVETDAVNPKSVYGKHKLEAEKIIEKAGSNHLILRITNVYGNEIRNKNFIARLIEDIKNGAQKTLTLPYDQYATPVNAYDVARAAALLLTHQKSGVYHIASTDFLNRVQLAQRVLNHFNYEGIKIEPASTAEINPPAERPLRGGMISHRLLNEFPDFQFSNVDDYLHSLG